MSLDVWLKIIEQILGEFHTLNNAAPDWLVDAETGSRLIVDRLYPELGLVIRFKGAVRAEPQGEIAFMKESARDAIYERLCRQADMALVVIDPESDTPARALAELRTVLNAASRRIAQRKVAREAKLALLPRIASAKTACQRIAGAISSPDGLQALTQTGMEEQAQVLEQVAPAPPPEPEPEPQPIAEPSGPIPVQPRKRIEFVDILRGFALFGVLAVNMTGFAGQSLDFRQLTNAIDKTAVLLIRFLLQAKFYTMFSFLFGWGMSMQMRRAEAKESRFTPVYLRRLTILLIFGLLHGILLWDGDILTAYALLGFVLLLFRKRSPRLVLAAAAIALLFRFVLAAPGEVLDTIRSGWDNLTAFMRYDTYPDSLYATGSFLDVSRLRLQHYLGTLSRLFYYGDVFAMFLLGLYVGQRRIFQQIDSRLPLVRRVMWIGLTVGAILNGISVSIIIWPAWVPQEYRMFVAVGSRTIGAPALMLFYISAIILLIRKKTWYQRLAPLAYLGRSALSNYLLQSIICSLIFYGYGLGLYGELGLAWGLALTSLIYYTQIRLSEWWFDRYQFGPMEWLWRTLTYGRRQPLRLGETYADLKPTRKIALAGLTAVLLCAAGLAAWKLWPDKGTEIKAPLIGARRTSTPTAAPTAVPTAIPTPIVQPVAYKPGPIAASGDLLALASTFDTESALAHIETLTGPPYLGRYPASPGGRAAGDYIAQKFAEYGLQPAGDDGSFFQAFPVEYVILTAAPRLIVEGPDGTIYDDYAPYRDYSPMLQGYTAAGAASGDVVWANNCAHTDLDALPVTGKILLCRDESLRQAGRNALEHGAAGLLLLTDPQRRPADFGSTFRSSWVPEPIPALRVYPSVLDELLLGSGKSVEDLSIHFDSFPLATDLQMTVTTTGAESCPAEGCRGRNVLGVIPGRDPAYADQLIVIGAHYDHLGQSPDGTIWPGANDDASGVALLLEIARAWQEQGYVPRHTVLFAAWDAEEMGLLGSTFYVEHPRYPPAKIAAMIQLDMVGAGGDRLYIDGKGDLAETLRAAAESLGIETEITSEGRSDHVPFQKARIPAALLIWHFEEGAAAQYHRPLDTPAIIEASKLEAVGKITGLTVLGLSEGQAAIDDLLARRAAALRAGDLAAFLATSSADQQSADRLWFADAQTFSPTGFEMQTSGLRVLGRTATAQVDMALEYQVEGETKIETASLDVKFTYGEGGWQWAGPDLLWADESEGLAVAYPPGKEKGLAGLGKQAAENYAEIASALGLPAETKAALMLFSGPKSLWVSTGLSLPRRDDAWIGPGAVKMIYSSEISASTRLTDALAQLALVEAGVTENAAPWLWRGLPLAWRAQNDPLQAQTKYLPRLQDALAADPPLQNEAASWAALDYLRRQIGWPGIGEFITALGQACRDGHCESAEVMQMTPAAFEAAWQAHWRERLSAAQAGLDAVLAARAEALLSGDEIAFLNTVDPAMPNLIAEEKAYLALTPRSVESFALSGEPLAFLEDGSLLAKVTLQYRLAGNEGSVPLRVRFTPDEGGYRWAGAPLETLPGRGAAVLYPAGQEELAQSLLKESENLYPQIAAALGIGQPDALTIKLYESADAFRAFISPAFPRADWLMAWTGAGQSIKLWLPKDAAPQNYRPALAVQLARHLLYQMGVEVEWLYRGASLYLVQNLDGGLTEQAVAENLSGVLRAISKERLGSLAEMPPAHELSQEEFYLTNTQAWDAVRYLVYTHGQDALLDLLHGQSLEAAIGQTLPEFEAAWAESLARAHAAPEWIEIANAFDAEKAYEHVETLAAPEMAGRQAGSAGADEAAAYIAGKFAGYGLQPLGGAGDFEQRFPISYTTLLSTPLLELVDKAGRAVESLSFREDFLLILGGSSSDGGVTGEMVWVRDENYADINLDGKIALRRLSDDANIGQEIERAIEHGAGALILIGEEENKKEFLAKTPLPVSFISEEAIPVLELTQNGYSRILEITGRTPPALQNSPPALPLGSQFHIEIPLAAPETVETANLLGLLPGSDPVLSQEVIILSAHYDHVGDDPDRRYPGANDDASGIAVLLEIARLWQESGYRPARSVLFAAWGAQEMGMLGSQYYVEHPALSLEETVAVLQLDAVGGGGGHYMEAQGLRGREGLWLFNMEVAEDLVDGRLKISVPRDPDKADAAAGAVLFISPFEGLGNVLLSSRVSDHVTFHRLGIPALLVTWRGASEDNWPEELAYEVEPYRLGVTGRMATLATMSIAR